MDEKEFSNRLTIEEPYRKELVLGLEAMDYTFDNDSERESFINILNHPKCLEIVRKSKLEDVLYFPEFIFMQIGNYSKEPEKLLKEDINEESFRNYLAD